MCDLCVLINNLFTASVRCMLVLYRRYVYQRCLTIDVLVAMTIVVLIESLSKKKVKWITTHPPTRPQKYPRLFSYWKKKPSQIYSVVLSDYNVFMTCASFTGSFLDEWIKFNDSKEFKFYRLFLFVYWWLRELTIRKGLRTVFLGCCFWRWRGGVRIVTSRGR